MDLGKATLQVEVDSSGARSGVNDAVRAFDIMKRRGQEAVQGISSWFGRLKDQLFSLKGLLAGWGLFELVKSFIDAGKQTEIFTDRLQVLLGSVKEGNRLFKEMQAFAIKSPFQYKDVMESATTLAAVLKGGVNEIKEWMPLISDLAVAAGLGIQETTGQVVKMLSAGAGAADMFRERGILAMLGFQQKVQYSASQTREMLIKAFTDPQSKFRDASIAMMSTWEGVVSNIEDRWFQFQQSVMVDGRVLNYIKALVQTISDRLTDAFGQGTDAAKNFADFLIRGMESGAKAIAVVVQTVNLFTVGIQTLKEAYRGLVALWHGADAEFLQKDLERNNDAIDEARKKLERYKELGVGGLNGVSQQSMTDAQNAYNDAVKKGIEIQSDLAVAQEKAGTSALENDKQMQVLMDTIDKFNKGAGPDFDKFLADVKTHFDEYNEKTAKGFQKTKDFRTELDKFAQQGGLTQKQQKQLNQAWDEGVGILSKLDEHIMGAAGDLSETDKIWSDYGKNIADISKQWTEYEQHAAQLSSIGITEEMVRARVTKAVEAETKARDAHLAAYEREIDFIGKANKELDQQFATLGMDDRSKFIHDVIQRVLDDYDKLSEKEKELHPLNQQGIADLKARAGAFYDESQAIEQGKDIRREYVGFWSSMLNDVASNTAKFFTGQIKSWKDFGNSLLDSVKNLVAQIIEQWLKLSFVNPIINALFGNIMGAALPTMGGGGYAGLLFGGGGAGGGAGGGSILNTATGMVDAGQKLWTGFKDGWTSFFGTPSANAYSGFLGTYTGAQYGGAEVSGFADEMGFVPDYGASVPYSPGVAPGSYTYTPSPWVQGAGIAGGVYAGYNRWQGSNHDAGGALGAAAYGYGTYAATIGTGAALSGGMAAGMAAIPVVGWIALAAMLVDMISGGKLFGTGGKVIGGGSNIDVTAGGADLSQWYTTKGQKAFFGGATYKEHSMAVDAEAQHAVDVFFQQLVNQSKSFATFWGTTMGDVVGGSFEQRFDKHGNLTGSTTTVGGRSFEGETQEQFMERLYAQQQIQILRSGPGVDVTSYTDQFIQNADSWAQAVQSVSDMLAQAKADYGSGQFLLDAKSSLNDVYQVVESYATAGEDINQVYSDLMKSTQGLKDIYAALDIETGKSAKEFVAFGKSIADAAGGADAAAALYDSFKQHYLSPDEIQQRVNSSLQSGAMQAIGDLGDAGKGLNFSNFRERFEKVLPTLSAEDLTKWLRAGDALAKLADALGSASMATTDLNEALANYKDIQSHVDDDLNTTLYTATDALNHNFTQVLDIANAYDGSAESQANLLAAVDQRYVMEMAYLRKIRDITQQINDSIQSDIEDIKTSQMGNGSKYAYFKQQAEDLAQQLATMTDPDQINATVAKIRNYEAQAWALLTPEQQKYMADGFIKFLQGVQDEADRQLEAAGDNVETQNDQISKAVEDAFKRVGETQQQAADTQNTAADKNLEAANTISNTTIRVVVVDNRSEAGGGGGGGRGYLG